MIRYKKIDNVRRVLLNCDTFVALRSSSGFTLVEAVVVVGITIILTSIMITYSRGSEQQILFFREQSLITSSILQAKGFAIHTFQPDFQPQFTGTESITPICGWGVHVEEETATDYPNTIIIFKRAVTLFYQ